MSVYIIDAEYLICIKVTKKKNILYSSLIFKSMDVISVFLKYNKHLIVPILVLFRFTSLIKIKTH